MGIEVISIGSSSSGNSYIVRATSEVMAQDSDIPRLPSVTTILVDVGLPAKAIMASLAANEIPPSDVSAVLITHEHCDHVKSIRAISRRCENAVFFASKGTICSTESFKFVPDERIVVICGGETVDFGNTTIEAFDLSHDAAEPIGYSVETGTEKLTIVTDTGIVTDEIYEAMKDSELLVLEANHDEELLLFGEYPYSVKVRIKSDHGHLSNAYAGHVLARILRERQGEAAPLTVMLAHLSDNNNAPFYARRTIEDILEDGGFLRDQDYKLVIATKDEPTVIFAENSGTN